MKDNEDKSLNELSYNAGPIIITKTPYDTLFKEYLKLRKKRILEAEKTHGVKIDFDTFLLVGTNENGLEIIQDQYGNKIILPLMTKEEIELSKKLDKEMEKYRKERKEDGRR